MARDNNTTEKELGGGTMCVTTPLRVVTDWHSRSHSDHSTTGSDGLVAPPEKEISTLVECRRGFCSGPVSSAWV